MDTNKITYGINANDKIAARSKGLPTIDCILNKPLVSINSPYLLTSFINKEPVKYSYNPMIPIKVKYLNPLVL